MLGISYVYTYKSDELKDVSYKVEGYLILVTLLVKGLRHAYAIYSSRQKEKNKEKNNIGQPVTQALSREGQEVK